MELPKEIFRWIAAAVATILVTMPAYSADPTLLKDISTIHYSLDVEGVTQSHLYSSAGKTYAFDSSGRSAAPILPKEIDGEFFALGAVALFGYSDDLHGQELWRSDGTRAGTYLVKDLVDGPTSGEPRNFVQWRGKTYFTTTPGGNVRDSAHFVLPQLWSTDGTPEGTVLITEIDTSVRLEGAEVPRTVVGRIVRLAASEDRLFFNVSVWDRDYDLYQITLWQSDGTAAGTLKMVYPENNRPVFASYLLQSVGGATYFADEQPYWSAYAYDWEIGKLWRMDSDGQQLTVVTEALASPKIAAFDGYVYFFTRDENGLSLARTSEGDTAVETVALLYPAASLRTSNEITFVRGTQSLFIVINNGYWGGNINAIWRVSTGKSLPTKIVDLTGYVDMNSSAVKNDVLYFRNGPDDNTELWRSDGTLAGTAQYSDLRPIGSSNPDMLRLFAGEIWFTADDGSPGQLFRTTESDSIAKLPLGVLDAASSQPRQFTTLNNGITLFRGRSWYYEMYATAGTPETTVRPRINSYCGTCLFEPLLPPSNGALFLDTYQATLWYTNGGDEVQLVKRELWPAVINNYPITKNVLTPLSANAALFLAVEKNADLTYSRKLWRTDGTAEGTVLVKTMAFPAPPSIGVSLQGIEALVRHKHLVYFMGNDDRNGNELWRSDGTETGTFMVKDLVPGNAGGSIQNITSARNQIYFTYADGYGTYLAKSRGSEKDTVHIATLPGNIKSIQNATSVNDSLFFRAGSALYRSNGQRGDLRRLGQFAFNSPGESSYYRTLPATAHPAAMTAYGDHLYFVARKGAKDPLQVWRADTKKNKAEIVSPQFKVRASGANDVSFAVHAGRLFLAVMDRTGQNGGIFELRTRGKTMQWVQHTNMSARELHITGDNMYFAGLDTLYGEEPRVMALPVKP